MFAKDLNHEIGIYKEILKYMKKYVNIYLFFNFK